MADTQAHHILPTQLFNEFAFLREMQTRGLWYQNSRDFNLIGLPNTSNVLGLNVHSGPHGAYTDWYRDSILSGMQEELEGLTGAARTAKLAEFARELIGVNNYLKSQFLDYRSEISLHKFDGDGSGFFMNTTMATIESKLEYQLGVAGIAIPVWVDSKSPIYSGAFSAVTSMDPAVRAQELQAYVRALDAEYDKLSLEARQKLVSGNIYAREAAGVLLHEMAYGDAKYTPGFVSNFLNGTGPKVLTFGAGAGAFSLFSPDMAQAAVHVIGGMDKGSALVDGLSLTLLGYAFVESGVLSDLDVSSMIRLLGNSNIASVIGDKIDNIALDIGKEVLISSIATMLGVGLLWKGYEIYQSIDGLKAALAVAAQYGDSALIKQLNDMVIGVEATLDSWFDPAHGGNRNYVPEYEQFADLLTQSFSGLSTTAGNDPLWTIGSMLRDYILEKHPELVPNPFALPATNLEILLELLAAGASKDGKTLQQAFEAAMVEGGFYADNPALFAMMPPSYCFAAGTLIDMADGSHKPVERIVAGDMVLSFDAQGALVPGRVARVFARRATQLLDFHGTRVTPGHVYLCGEGRFAGQYVALIDILRSDGAVVARDGGLIRAATGAPVGSEGDVALIWVALGTLDAAGGLVVRDARQMRAATRVCLPDGRDLSLADMLAAAGATLTEAGLVRMPDGQERMFHWTLSDQLPRPEDYVLARSGTDLAAIFDAAEWEDAPPRLTAPGHPAGRRLS